MGKIPLNRINFDDFDDYHDAEYFESKRTTKRKAKNETTINKIKNWRVFWKN